MRLFFFALMFTTTVTFSGALDVSWIPAGDGPLPLSAKYRDRLARVCELDAKGALPRDLSAGDLRRVRKSCERLARDKSVGGGDYGSLLSGGGGPSVMGILMLVLVAVVLWLQNSPQFHRWFSSATAAARPPSMTSAEVSVMREARMAKLSGAAKVLTGEQKRMLDEMRRPKAE